MRNALVLALTGLCTACASLPPVGMPATAAFTLGHVAITPLGHGVYAATRLEEPLGLAQNANSLFIVNDTDVVVVDAQFTREATLENLAALRRITSKPVSYVVTTHWHDDHFAGNQVYQDSFPHARFLAHANTRADLIARGRPNREQQLKFAPQVLDRFDRLLALGLGGDSTPLSDLERAALTADVRIARQYVKEAPGFREVLPDTMPGARTWIAAGARRVELHWFGRAATRGDVVVWVPDAGVLASGDVIDAPVPFAFGAYPSEWIAVLDSIDALHPRVIVPGHGPVLQGDAQLATIRAMLVAMRDQTHALVAAGASRDTVLSRVRLDDYRARIAGDEKWLEYLFENFRRASLSRLYQEASGRALE